MIWLEFSKKPVALITASLSGEKAHRSLLGTLLIIEAKMTANTQLIIPFTKTKLNSDFKITDRETLNSINKLIHSLTKIITTQETGLLSAHILMNEGTNSGQN